MTVNSGTNSVANLMARDETKQYSSFQFNNDLTTSSIQITFDNTTSVSRIALIGINAKSFRLFYNGDTSNALALQGDTSSSVWSSNSETSLYLAFDSISATQIDIEMTATQVADSEKILSYFGICDTKLDFTRFPDSKGYKALIDAQEIVHTLSDGGTRVNSLGEKFSLDLKLKAIPRAMRDSLRSIFMDKDDFIFSAFGTTTSYEGIFYPVVWIGNFAFYQYNSNNVNSGYDGAIKLREIPT